MLDGLEGWHIVIIVAIAAVLFGSTKLPGAARSMGQSLRIFKSELRAGAEDGAVPGPTAAGAAQTVVTPPAALAPPAVIIPSAAPVATPTPVATPAPFAEPVTQSTPAQQ
jgi:sec-independent protein translocase protein TatA